MSIVANRKLKVWSGGTSNVLVVQDGTTSDGDATLQVDNGFRAGVTTYAGGQKLRNIVVELLSLRSSYEETTFTFRLHHGIWSNSLNIQPNDIVEFYADVGDALSSGGGTLPSWHHGNSANQIRLFYGKIRACRPTRQGGRAYTDFECVDPRSYANDIVIVRDYDNGVQIPHLIFNADEKDDDWIFAIKKSVDATYPSVPTFAAGVPTTDAGKLSVYDALRYLQAVYESELDNANVKASGTDLFVDSEINGLTTTLPKTDFVNIGFTDAVLRVLAAVPDRRLIVDPKTRIWHLITAYHQAVPGEQTTTTTDTGTPSGGFVDVDVTDPSIFSTTSTEDGYNVRLIDGDNPQYSSETTVSAIVSNTLTLADPGRVFPSGTLIVPLHPDSLRMPQVEFDIDDECISTQLSRDLSETFTAVSIVSSTNKTTMETASSNNNAVGYTSTLSGLWDSNFEEGWRHVHGDRVSDYGSDGGGIEVYDHQVISTVSNVWFRASKSQYGDDHDIQSGVGEWEGCAFKLMINEGVDVSGDGVIVTIDDFVSVADVDGSGNLGYKLILSHDLTATVTAVSSEVTPTTGIDRFVMTQDLSLVDVDGAPAVQQFNRRWPVFRAFAHTDTSIRIGESSGQNCNPQVTYFGGQGGVQRQEPAFNPFSQQAAPRTYDEQRAFWDPILGAGNYHVRAFFLKTPARMVGRDPCAARAWIYEVQQNERVEVTYEKVTNSIRQVRIPSSGYSGFANAFYGLEREKFIIAERFDDDSKSTQYTAIAESDWRVSSLPVYTGNIQLRGVQPWLGLSDLCYTARLTTANVTAGAVNDLQRFLVPVDEVEFDFANSTTTVGFSNQNNRIEAGVLERLFIEDSARLKALQDQVNATKSATNCINKSSPSAAPATPACSVQLGIPGGPPIPLPPGGGRPPIKPKQEILEVTEDMATYNDAGGKNIAVGVLKEGVIERDTLGNYFWSTPSGIYPASISGGVLSLTPLSSADSEIRISGLPQVLKADITNVVEGLLGAGTEYPIGVLHAQVGASATTTVIPIIGPGLAVNEYAGGTISILDETARPTYTISSNTARDDGVNPNKITLSGAMSEAAPSEGAMCVIRPPLKATLDATDYPDGGTAITDANGNWLVIEPDGTITDGSESGGVITDGGGGNTPTLNIGNSAVTLQPQGTWDWSGATHTSDPWIDESVLTTQGDIIYRGASSSTRLAIGAANTVLISNGTAPTWAKIRPADMQLGTGGTEVGLHTMYSGNPTIVTSTSTPMRVENATGTEVVFAAKTTGMGDSIQLRADGSASFGGAVDGITTLTTGTSISTGDVTMTGALSADSSTGSADQMLTGGSTATWADVVFSGTPLIAYLTNAISSGSKVRGLIDTTDNKLGMTLGSGVSFYVTGWCVRVQTGSAAGTYTVNVGIRRIEAANADTPSTDTELGTMSSASTSTWIQTEDYSGTLSTPLATIAGGSGYRLIPYIENDATSPGALTSAKHSVIIYGYVA